MLYITTYSVKIISSFFTKFSLLFSDILFIAIPQNNAIKTVQQSAKDAVFYRVAIVHTINQISSYISMSSICAVSTMLVPESMLHFWICLYASSSVIWFFSISRRLAFEI